MNLSGDRPRYRGVRQVDAVRGIVVGAYLSAMLWIGLGYAVTHIL